MPFKKFIKTVFRLCCALIITLTIALLVLFISLPAIVETQIEKRVPQFLNPNDIEFDIKKIGFLNTSISKIRVSKGISIDSINIDYNIRDNMSSIRLNKVTVSGLNIHASLDENSQIKIQGLDFPELSKDQTRKDQPQKDQVSQPDLPFLAFLPEKIVLRNAKIILHTLNGEFLIPFDLLSSISTEDEKIVAQAIVYPFGEKINALVTYDINRGIEFLKIKGNSFDLGHIDQFISKKTSELQLKGSVDFILETSSPQKEWKINVSRIGFVQPVEAAVKDLSTTFLIDNQKISAGGTFNISHSLLPTTRIEYGLTLNLKNDLTKNYHFDFKLKNAKTDNYKIAHESTFVNIKKPQLSVRLSGTPLKSRGKVTFGLEGGRIQHQKEAVLFDDINIEIPIQYPNIKKRLYGKYSIPTISYNNQYKFSTNGKILQTDSKKIQVSGGVTFKRLPDLKVQFKSIVGFEKGLYASLDFKTNPVKLNYADVEKLMGQGSQNADIDVTVSARGKAELLNHRLKTFMQANVSDGNISIPDMNLTATGINTVVDFNNLLVPKSVPGQILTIDSIQVNKIKIDEAKVRFTIEDTRSLLIENIRFKWCNGLVSSESIRFPQENNAYSLSLYCDRLELAQLLKQVGAFNAQGSGTLNGRIPVVYSDGNISFDNGFLFSTPGSGGKVVIENTDSITAGIPMDSPRFVQLDLAREALKDFEYKWAKLIFNTFEETLFVNMELDGKPSQPLPFEYRKDLGSFIRVDTSSPGSIFQGIKLDVNLKLPFNEVMKFGNKLKSVFN